MIFQRRQKALLLSLGLNETRGPEGPEALT